MKHVTDNETELNQVFILDFALTKTCIDSLNCDIAVKKYFLCSLNFQQFWYPHCLHLSVTLSYHKCSLIFSHV